MDRDMEVVVEVVARGIVAHALAVLVFTVLLGAMLLDFCIAAQHLGELDDVGVGVAPTGLRGDDQELCVLVEHDVSAPGRKRARGVKGGQTLGVRFAIGELLADVVYGARAMAMEERRELARAFLAQIAFVDLGLSQKSQFGTADRALFLFEHLVEEAHGSLQSS